MFNDSPDIKFLLEGDELYAAIIDAIDEAMDCMYDFLEINHVEPESVTAGAKNPFRYCQIFKFLHDYKNPTNTNIFNKDWVLNLEGIRKATYNRDKSIDPTRFKSICSEYGKSQNISATSISLFKPDIDLLLHCLWTNKAILLTPQHKLPIRGGKHGSHFEYAAKTYPEVLQVFRKNKISHIKYDVKDITPSIGIESSVDNMNWGAFRLIRASDWYEIEDISNEDIQVALTSKKNINIPFPINQWFRSLANTYPERIKYSTDPKNLKRQPTLKRQPVNFVNDGTSNGELSDDLKGKIDQWCSYINKWVELRKTKFSSWREDEKCVSMVVAWLVNEVATKQPECVPSISEFSRVHIEDNDTRMGLLNHVKSDNLPSTFKAKIYKIDYFFDYLATYKDLNFKNPIIRYVDFPFVKRGSQTVKEIFPSAAYATLMSYIYAIAEWAWWALENNLSPCRDKLITTKGSNRKIVIDTAQSGFTPIYWHDSKPHAIRFIPRQLISLNGRDIKNIGYEPSVPNPSFIHLSAIIGETGIRLMHLRWLDVRSYRCPTNNDAYKPRTWDINRMHVNTDKSHGPWDAVVSNTVVEMLDRQAEYRAYINDETLDSTIWYQKHEGNEFGKIKPLFAHGISGRNGDGELPISDTSFRDKYRVLLYSFDFMMVSSHKEESTFGLEYDIPSDRDININDYEAFLRAFDKEYIDITPHSARSQVVSEHITLLPPSEIKKITGHTTDEHVVFYAQIEKTYLDKAKQEQLSAIMREDIPIVSSIRANEENSKLRAMFSKDRAGTLHDFAATTNDRRSSQSIIQNSIELIKTKEIGQIAFNTTHICPFNNDCPNEVINDFRAAGTDKPCGGCYYSVKTVDHIPAILAKIHALTDESEELLTHITEAKNNGAELASLEGLTKRRRFLSDETLSWSISHTCLEIAAEDLSKRDCWLVGKPEMLSKHLEKVILKNGSLESLFLKSNEALSYAEFFTPALKHQLTTARAKLLAYTGNFKELLDSAPNDYSLIDQFRGQVKSICHTLGVNIYELSDTLSKPLSINDDRHSPLKMISKINEVQTIE